MSAILGEKYEQVLETAKEKILFFSPNQMEDMLWDIFCFPEKSFSTLGFKEGVTTEQALYIRYQLAYTYRKANPDWNYGKRFQSDTKAREELWNALQGEKFAFDTIMGRITSFLKDAEWMWKRNVRYYLLRSVQPSTNIAGLMALQFTLEEAERLVLLAKPIGRILDETLSVEDAQLEARCKRLKQRIMEG